MEPTQVHKMLTRAIIDKRETNQKAKAKTSKISRRNEEEIESAIHINKLHT